MPITYIAGEHYCVLSIPKQKAQQYGIDNPSEVEIETTQQSIMIKSKNAGVRSASAGRDVRNRILSKDADFQ
jgi:hypothetical protein